MRRSALTLALVALLALPAAAADQPVTLLPAIGGRVHYRVVRTMQTTNGPVSATTLFDLVRKTDTTVVIERHDASGSPNLSVLKTGTDGSLAISEDARGTAADADLTDLLFGLNMALAATHGADPSARSGWAATVPVAPARGAATAALTMIPMNVVGSEFDSSGVADAGIATPSNPSPSRRGAGGRGRSSGGISFPGGGSGGFPGGGRSGARSRPDDDGGARPVAGANGGMVTTVHIDGHAGGGRVNRVTITQTRSITLANLPFSNVGSWSISVLK